MISIENDSVKVHVKSIVFDGEGHRNPIYWMTAVGPKVALQSVFATLVSKKWVKLIVGGEEKRKYGIEFYEHDVTIPDGGKMHAIYKKLQSGLSTMVMYSSIAKTDSEDNSWGAVVLLCAEDEDKKDALFHFLNSKVKIPLCSEWKDWVWSVVSKSERNMRPLVSCGLVGFYLLLDACEEAIEKAIGPAIKKGILKK